MFSEYILMYSVVRWNTVVGGTSPTSFSKLRGITSYLESGVFHDITSGWWLSLPRWKMMEFVSWDDEIPIYGKIKTIFQTTNQTWYNWYNPLADKPRWCGDDIPHRDSLFQRGFLVISTYFRPPVVVDPWYLMGKRRCFTTKQHREDLMILMGLWD